jgi:SAM-dependent methyltransferase
MLCGMTTPPLPDTEMARRTGVLDQVDPVASFDDLGRRTRDWLVGMQPADWFTDRRILDFGCGSGKVLRHLGAEARTCEIYGCDIHEPSIRWIEQNLDPALRVFTCATAPPLDLPDAHIDLVWAMSVFTHITDRWADWLLEIHRVMKPGARFIATFLGEGMSQSIAHEPWDPDRVGMNVLCEWQDWDRGGPSVQLSPWWIRAHWGRLFEIEAIEDGSEGVHGVLTVRKRDVCVTADELRAPADDPREWAALRHNRAQVSAEAGLFAAECDALEAYRASVDHQLERLGGERDQLQATLGSVLGSRSWTATAPLRALMRRLAH